MVLTSEELQKWNIDSLKKCLMDRGVPLSGGSRKADLIRKCILADELQLPILPFVIVRSTEITDRRFQKLKIGYVKIPFPEEIVAGWMKDLVYLHDLTLDCLKSYAKKSVAEKGFKEGKNLQLHKPC